MPPVKHKALIVGVSKYPKWCRDLPSVANDAREVTKLLSTKKLGAIIKKENAITLTNRKATKAQIIKDMKLTMKAAASATVVVYFAGHGGIENDRFYFVPHGAKKGKLESTGVALDEIRDIFMNSQSSKKLLLLDFCYSGGINARSDEDSSEQSRVIEERTLGVVQGAGNVIISACGPHQKAYGNDTGHGHFTGALLRGLRGEASDCGEINVASLYSFIDRELAGKQQPQMYGNLVGRMVLSVNEIKKATPAEKPPTKKKSSRSKVARKPPSWTSSSGRWTMLGDLVFESSVKANGSALTLNVTSSDAVLDAAFARLTPNSFGTNQTLHFAHQNEWEHVKVKEITYESMGRGKKWEVTLESFTDRFQLGSGPIHFNGQSYSEEEIAILKARKILLNEKPVKQDDLSNQFFETSFLGLDKLSCPFPSVLGKYSDKSKPVRLKVARLSAIASLLSNRIVDHIFQLKLRFRKNCIEIAFVGERASVAQPTPVKIEVTGVCLLK